MSLDFYLDLLVATGAKPMRQTVYMGNYTHNVRRMWELVGVYEALYKSDGATARDLIPVFKEGCKTMRRRIAECRSMNPSNGWGDADGALRFLGKTTAACLRYPNAKVGISA